jgi:hypothetical protein
MGIMHEQGATMTTKASDRQDLYLHPRAHAFRLEVAIFTEQCCAGDDTVYGNGQKYKPLTDTEYEALQTDLERVEVEIKEIEKGMRAVELAWNHGAGHGHRAAEKRPRLTVSLTFAAYQQLFPPLLWSRCR